MDRLDTSTHEQRPWKDHFIICGLGRLGQQTLLNLSKFGSSSLPLTIVAIDKVIPQEFEESQASTLLSQDIILGDCRRLELLREAGIQQCRSILLLTRDENTHIETALLV